MLVEADCFQRAWSALTKRVTTLKHAFGQLVSSTGSDGASFWVSLRQSFDSGKSNGSRPGRPGFAWFAR